LDLLYHLCGTKQHLWDETFPSGISGSKQCFQDRCMTPSPKIGRLLEIMAALP